MLETISLEEAQTSLPDLIERLAPGTEILITRDQQTVAALRVPETIASQPRFGSCRGALTILADDDEHLQDFQEYLP